LQRDKWISEAVKSADSLSLPAFALPRLTCDTHMHVFGPGARYPSIEEPHYTLPPASLSQYLAMASRIGVERMVFVQPSYYGTDNSCLLDAMAEVGGRCRGVVFLPPSPPASLIDRFARHGVRGLRLDLFQAQRANAGLPEIRALLKSSADLARGLGWHIELYAPGRLVRKLISYLPALNIDFIVNHMGYMTEEEGLSDADFRQFVSLAASSEHCWVKLTAPYRIVKDGSHARTDWMAKELIGVAPSRMLWGTDWPHVMATHIDAGEILGRLETWCADKAARDRILADNPARLYDF
jgi:predicted TIM-barrel fold metal-dependent hydrolase